MRGSSFVVAVLVFALAGVAQPAAEDDAASWIEVQGGHVMKDSSGRITGVNLASTWITDVDLERVGELRDLQKLDLSHTAITDVGLEHLKKLRNVTDLNLYYAEYITDSGLSNLVDWSRLERLDLHGTKITSKALEHIGRLTSLKSLDISFTAIDDDGFENLATLAKLEKLAIGGDRLTGTCLGSLKLLPSLVDLDVGGMQWVDSGLWGLPLNDGNLRQIGALTHLRVLSLNGANLTDRGADRPGSPEAIRKDLKNLTFLSGLVNLEVLDLSRTPVTAESLAPLKSLPKLREIRLGMASRIDDTAIPILASMKSLKAVYVAGTQITPAGIAKLPGLE
jgi:Leucine-rich repeat (LRR) protein